MKAYPIQVEVILAVGLTNFIISGLPYGTIRESKERIHAAIRNNGYGFPVR